MHTATRTAILLTGAALICAALPSAIAQDKDKSIYKDLDAFGDALEAIRETYYETPDDRKLIEGAIKGMVKTLDPGSSYYTAEDLKARDLGYKGEFGGIGAEVTYKDEALEIIVPLDGTPAANAGLQPGDRITHIDGESLAGLDLVKSIARLRGKAGSRTVLTVARAGDGKPEKVEIVRGKIVISGVRHRAEGKIGYLRIASFNKKTPQSVRDAVEDLNKRIGSGLKGYIIDLRNCPGGPVDETMKVTDDFLDAGTMLMMRGRTADRTTRYEAKSGDIAKGKPIVVLINGGTAGGGEIMAGALQDHKRAKLVGSQTFGRGKAARIIRLKNFGALSITSDRYYTPSGRVLEGSGVMPDVVLNLKSPNRNYTAGKDGQDGKNRVKFAYVPKDAKDDTQLSKAIELLNAGEFKPAPAAGGTAGATGGLTVKDLGKLD